MKRQREAGAGLGILLLRRGAQCVVTGPGDVSRVPEGGDTGPSWSLQARDIGCVRLQPVGPCSWLTPSHLVFHASPLGGRHGCCSCVSFQNTLCLHVQTPSSAYLFPFSNTRGSARPAVLPRSLSRSRVRGTRLPSCWDRAACPFSCLHGLPSMVPPSDRHMGSACLGRQGGLSGAEAGCGGELELKGQASSEPVPFWPIAPGPTAPHWNLWPEWTLCVMPQASPQWA